jgi:hypothetical protein
LSAPLACARAASEIAAAIQDIRRVFIDRLLLSRELAKRRIVRRMHVLNHRMARFQSNVYTIGAY